MVEQYIKNMNISVKSIIIMKIQGALRGCGRAYQLIFWSSTQKTIPLMIQHKPLTVCIKRYNIYYKYNII